MVEGEPIFGTGWIGLTPSERDILRAISLAKHIMKEAVYAGGRPCGLDTSLKATWGRKIS